MMPPSPSILRIDSATFCIIALFALMSINGSVPITLVKYFLYSRAVIDSILSADGFSNLPIILSISLSKPNVFLRNFNFDDEF